MHHLSADIRSQVYSTAPLVSALRLENVELQTMLDEVHVQVAIGTALAAAFEPKDLQL